MTELKIAFVGAGSMTSEHIKAFVCLPAACGESTALAGIEFSWHSMKLMADIFGMYR